MIVCRGSGYAALESTVILIYRGIAVPTLFLEILTTDYSYP